MATRMAEALKLVARVRRVGWPVEQIDGGVWKVTCPDRVRVQIHQTPSDRYSTTNTLKDLNDHGLAAAEAELSAKDEEEKAAKLAADREANERRTLKAVKQATALAKAAGPYGPAQVTLAQLLGEHPSPRVFHQVVITPEMARAMLERNSHNRPIRRPDIAEWSTVLRTGRWRYTHQGLAFDRDGRLQDGQHRLSAIVETGIEAEMMVSVGMPPENFSVVDTGRRRTAAQVLALSGATYASWLSGAVRLLCLYETWAGAMLDHTSDRVGNDVIADAYEKMDGDDLLAACRLAQRLRAEIGTGPSGPVAAFYLIGRAVAPDAEPANAYAEALIHGGADETDPTYVVRRSLTRQAIGASRRLTSAEIMALVIKGWNAKLTGRKAATLTVRAGAAMPAPLAPENA